MKNYIREIIDRYLRYNYPEDMDGEVRDWLTDGRMAEEKDLELRRWWAATESTATEGFEQSLERMREMTGIAGRSHIRRVRRQLMVWRAAAAVIVLALLGSVYALTGHKDRVVSPQMVETYVPRSEMHIIILPDGTEATVNSQSTLIYPEEFTGRERTVLLLGEANFKVTHDASHPFVVKCADFQVTALGTEFNVKSYPNEDVVSSTLIEGKVRVEYNDMTCSEILSPGMRIVYNRANHSVYTSNVDVTDITAWQYGKLVMRGMTPDEIFAQLGRKFPYTFVYNPGAFKSDRFTLTFPAGATLEEVMHIISRVMGDISYRIESDSCRIMAKNR